MTQKREIDSFATQLFDLCALCEFATFHLLYKLL